MTFVEKLNSNKEWISQLFALCDVVATAMTSQTKIDMGFQCAKRRMIPEPQVVVAKNFENIPTR